MKVIAFNVGQELKRFLTVSNKKKHSLTWISDKLQSGTIGFASGKQAVVLVEETPSPLLLKELASLGIRYVICLYEAASLPYSLIGNINSIKVIRSNYGVPLCELLRIASTET